jgi:hypothetical protein
MRSKDSFKKFDDTDTRDITKKPWEILERVSSDVKLRFDKRLDLMNGYTSGKS